jgi:hypothetical protein
VPAQVLSGYAPRPQRIAMLGAEDPYRDARACQ